MIDVYMAVTEEDKDRGTVTVLVGGLPIDQVDQFIAGMREKLLPPDA